MTGLVEWGFLFFASFLPALIYVLWMRNTERYNKEKWRAIALCFFWGASIAIIAALILEVALEIPLALSLHNEDMISLLAAIVVAPIAEEFAKPLALRLKTVKKELDELEDGLIYGAVAGLGFAATENLIYGWSFLSEGFLVFFILMSMRSFGGCLLHASATALTGYGYGKTIMKQTTVVRVVPYFILAIFVHSFYNLLVSLDMIGIEIGLIAAFFFVAVTIILVRKKIRVLDEQTR